MKKTRNSKPRFDGGQKRQPSENEAPGRQARSGGRRKATIQRFGSQYAITSPADLLAHPPLPPPPTPDLEGAALLARVREIVIAVIAWVADLPPRAIGDGTKLSDATDHLHDQTYSSEMGRGLLLSRGQEISLYSGLVNEKWDTVGDLVESLDKTVDSNLHPSQNPRS